MARNSVGIGIVGMGFMGTTHFQAGTSLRGGKVVAIVTSDPRKAKGDFRHVQGNFGDGGGKIDLKRIHVHPTLDDLLADDKVDLVDICLPSHLHSVTAQRALKAGKHVLVEKPVALRPAEARRMQETARKSRKLIMVAQVLKFFPEFALIADAVQDNRWGKLLALHLRRRIARPDWGADSWFADASKSGGMIVDLHIHDTDFMVYLFGRPKSVTSQGVIGPRGRLDFLRTAYHYKKGGPLISSEGGWLNAPGLPFEHGYDAFFEDATCHFDSSRSPEPVLYRKKGPKPLRLKAPDAFRAELQEAIESVRRRKASSRLSAKSATTSLEVCQAEEKSVRSGKTVAIPTRK